MHDSNESADVALIKRAHPNFDGLKDETICDLWNLFSDYWYCANWMVIGDSTLKNFKAWLNGDN